MLTRIQRPDPSVILTLFYPGLVYVEVLTIHSNGFKTNVHLGGQALAQLVLDTFVT